MRVPSQKIYIIEENGQTLTDAAVEIWQRPGQWNKVGMLGLRHDRVNRVTFPDVASALKIVNPKGQANVLLADFHVEYIDRKTAHAKSRALPDASATAFRFDPEYSP